MVCVMDVVWLRGAEGDEGIMRREDGGVLVDDGCVRWYGVLTTVWQA